MRTKRMLWGLATGCAVLLLFAPLTPRTIWLPTARSAGAGQITEGVGWLAIAALLGIAALVALVLGPWAQRHVPVAAAGAAVATVAFGITAIGMGRHWIDLMNRVVSVRMDPGVPWVLHPAPLVPVFAMIAVVGAASAFSLAITGLRSETGSGGGTNLEERAG